MDNASTDTPMIIFNNKELLLNCTVVRENLNSNVINNSVKPANLNILTKYAPGKTLLLSNSNNQQKRKGKVRFKCLHCDYLTFKKQNLVLHLQKKHETKKLQEIENHGMRKTIEVFACAICKMTFGTLEKCQEHSLQHTYKEIYNNSSKNQPSKIITTNKINYEDIEYIAKCEYCKCKFRSENSKALHLLCHSNDSKDYKCSEKDCNFVTSRWNTCRTHLWKSHKINIDMFKCHVCKRYVTTTYHNLVNHISMKHGKTLTCVDCGAKFENSIQLQNHRVFHSKAKCTNKERWYTEKTCSICHMTLANSKSLKLHTKNVHLKLKPYVCQVCNHNSATKHMMQVHMRQHTGEKPFSCNAPNCNFKTGDHNSLRRHKLRHSEDRPYKCLHCDYKCIQVTALKSHITNNHQNIIGSSYFLCNQCTFGSVSLKRYNDHLISHDNKTQNGVEVSPVKHHDSKIDITDDDDTAQGFVDDTGGITISESTTCIVLNADDNAIMLT
ncbi:zinc finger protein 91-like [Daktulosphaira vitifoliae]|uniref:zinc finger protein 91-like n=1 Tax=Daktulosphaira vitifoliae TaxID=58002 RepID=UPI0021AA190B|nr:zinc finger protein 91-like [Daktulosphaira vitifoliae]